MDDGGLALQGAADAHEREGLGGDPEPFVDVAPQYDVDEAGLVFKGHEDHSPGGLGALAADDDAGVVHVAAVGHALHGGGGGKPQGGELPAQMGQRMATGAVVGGPVIPHDGLEIAQGLERDRRLGGFEGQGVPPGLVGSLHPCSGSWSSACRVAPGRVNPPDLPEGLAPPGTA